MTLLTNECLSQLREEAAADSRLRIARNAITNVGAAKAALDRDRITALYPTTEVKLDSLGVSDQKRSGRCWMFAALEKRGANFLIAPVHRVTIRAASLRHSAHQ